MRLHLVVSIALLASSLAACSVSPGVDSAVPDPDTTVSEIASTEVEGQDDGAGESRENARPARTLTAAEREASERLGHTAESARIQPSE